MINTYDQNTCKHHRHIDQHRGWLCAKREGDVQAFLTTSIESYYRRERKERRITIVRVVSSLPLTVF